MMNTKSSLSGRHWDPFLLELSKDPMLQPYCTLDEYGAPLIIGSKYIKVRCLNDAWQFLNMSDVEIERVKIPQDDNGNDTVDRLELAKTLILERLTTP